MDARLGLPVLGRNRIGTPSGIDVKSLKKLKAELLANPAVRQAYDAQAPKFELARELICIVQTSTPTAALDLIELERLGLLNRYGDGRSTRYYPAIEGWAEDDAKLGKASWKAE